MPTLAHHGKLLRRIVATTSTAGPASRNGLFGFAEGMTMAQFGALLDYWLAFGLVRQYGKRSGARYGAPGWRGLK